METKSIPINDDFVGVYKCGLDAVAVSRRSSLDSIDYMFLNLHDNSNSITISAHVNWSLYDIVSNDDGAIMIFTEQDTVHLLSVSLKRQSYVYLTIIPDSARITQPIEYCEARIDGSVVIIRPFLGSLTGSNSRVVRYWRGFEVISVRKGLNGHSSRLFFTPERSLYKVRRTYSDSNGYAILAEYFGTPHQLDLHLFNSSLEYEATIQLADSVVRLPDIVKSCDSSWIIAGSVVDTRLNFGTTTTDLFVLEYLKNRGILHYNQIDIQTIRDTVFSKKAERVFLAGFSPNSFRANGDMHLKFLEIDIENDQFNAIAEVFSIGTGMTNIELLMGINDPSERVISSYGFVELNLSKMHETTFKFIDRNTSNTLIEFPNTESKVEEIMILDKGSGVFSLIENSDSVLTYLDFDTLVLKISSHNKITDTDTIFHTDALPSCYLLSDSFYTRHQEYIDSSKLLSKLVEVEQRNLKRYDRAQKPMQKAAHRITDIDRYFVLSSRRDEGEIRFDSELIIYSYSKEEKCLSYKWVSW